jgi:hypothetical protein
VTPPSALFDDYPDRLEQIVLTALQREPHLRYQSAEEMQHELERYLATTGELVLPSHLGALMTETFADRIAEKREALYRAQRTFSPEILEQSHSTSLTLDENRAAAIRPRPHSRVPAALVVAGLVVALGAGVGGWLVLRAGRQKPRETTGQPAKAASPREVRILVRTDPPTATIEVDGKKRSNPFELTRPAASGTMAVSVSSAGFQTRTIQVPLNEGGTFYVSLNRLQPDAAPPAAKQATPAHKKPPPRRKPDVVGDDEDLYGNPFNK